MFKNFFIIALRNLLKQKTYTFINVLGLAIGITCFTLLFTLVDYEVSFDKHQPDAKRIYRIYEVIEKDGVGERSASVPFPLAPTLAYYFPDEIEKTVRIFNHQIPLFSVEYNKKKYSEKKFYFADSTFLDFFTFKFIEGNPDSALFYPNTVIISTQTSKKYFGDSSALGKELKLLGKVPLKVTGVFDDEMRPSHFKADFIASFSTLATTNLHKHLYTNWVWNPCWTYIKLKKGVKASHLEGELYKVVEECFAETKTFTSLYLQPLISIHLNSNLDYELEPNGKVRYVYIFSAIGILILLVAAINFVNLSTARFSKRAKEIAIRKAMGASHFELIAQFFIESLVLSLLGVAIALVLLEWIAIHIEIPSSTYRISELLHAQSSDTSLMVVSTGLMVGFFSGLYPSYYLAFFKPAEILQGNFKLNFHREKFRNKSVVIQFAICTFLIVSAFINIRQLHFLQHSALGFHKQEILVVPVAHTRLAMQYEEFKRGLLNSPSIHSVTGMDAILGQDYITHEYQPEGAAAGEYIFFPTLIVKPDFVKTFGLKIIAGKDFQTENLYQLPELDSLQSIIHYEEDSTAVLINAEMVRHLAWESPQAAIGKKFNTYKGKEKVIGVVDNFHFSSLHNPVMPLVIEIASGMRKIYHTKYLAMRIDISKKDVVIAHLKEQWEHYLPQQPLEYFFLDEKLNTIYEREEMLGEVSVYFAFLVGIIACMGLSGLASFVVEQKKREIAIRKALGASAFSIVLKLNLIFLRLVLKSIIWAWIFAYVIMYLWLIQFNWHVEMTFDVFIYGALIVIFISLATVSFHTIKIAVVSPMKVIRN